MAFCAAGRDGEIFPSRCSSIVCRRATYRHWIMYFQYTKAAQLIRHAQTVGTFVIQSTERLRCFLGVLDADAFYAKITTHITYLLKPITACPRSMVLRSTTDDELFTPRSRLKFGKRAFRISAPKAWNCLPHDIRLEACTNRF